MIVAFIDAYKDLFGVEPICRVLRDHDIQIAPSTYYAAKTRPPSARQLSDELRLEDVKRIHRENYGVYGVRKVWHALRREGVEIGRDQVARLMRMAGLRGVSRRARAKQSPPSEPEVRAPDLVQRDWFRDAPDVVWVSDFTHVFTREGWAYVSFLQDGFSRHILGFTVATSKTTELVSRALDQAISVRRRSDVTFIADGVLVHSDAGSQYTSLAYSQQLHDHGLLGSIGRIGTAYDNALMESTIGLFKTELIHRRQTDWQSRQEVETATARWVAWFNHRRLHGELGHCTPIEIEMAYAQQRGLPRQAA